MPPGFKAVRPETQAGAKPLTDPATNAFDFRQSQAGVPDIEGIRKFLTDGNPITGEQGTFVGKQYPGSLTGVKASQSGSVHDYTFGSVQSSVLQNSNTQKELRVDGKTITELNSGPIQMYITPAKKTPKSAKMAQNFVNTMKQIGIPVTQQVMSFNTMITKVYGDEDFDMYPMGWSSLSPFATSTLYNLFDSANADDHSKAESGKQKNTSTLLNNPMGYGLFDNAGADDLIESARTEMDAKKRNKLAAKAVEKIYLDFPTMVNSYDKVTWPVNSADWSGFIGNIPGPGSSYLSTQFLQLHKSQ